ncbi:Cytochrome c oxidase-assembly factor COX23, mitochondrial [Fonsecaea pedrosoi]|nr:Cytochrome c oxidase-assembly factor COX23, mitochondrial [Fonsecaea pedrosoi]
MASSAQSDQAASSEPQIDAWEKSKATFQSYALRNNTYRDMNPANVCARKRTSEYYDPCQEFANRSIKCMHRNKGDREMCQDYFK